MRAISKGLGLLALVLAGISANAQSTKVNIPFAFTVAGRTLAAGEYRFTFNPPTSIITIESEDSRSQFVMSAPLKSAEGGRSFLRFYCYGNSRVLQEVSISGTVRRLPSANPNKHLVAEAVRRPQQPIDGGSSSSIVTQTNEAMEI